MSTRISSEKIKPFDTNFEPSMSNLKFNNSALVKKNSSLHSNLSFSLRMK